MRKSPALWLDFFDGLKFLPLRNFSFFIQMNYNSTNRKEPYQWTAAAELCEKYAAKGFKTFDHCPNYKDLNEELIVHVTKKPPPSAVQSGGRQNRLYK